MNLKILSIFFIVVLLWPMAHSFLIFTLKLMLLAFFVMVVNVFTLLVSISIIHVQHFLQILYLVGLVCGVVALYLWSPLTLIRYNKKNVGNMSWKNFHTPVLVSQDGIVFTQRRRHSSLKCQNVKEDGLLNLHQRQGHHHLYSK